MEFKLTGAFNPGDSFRTFIDALDEALVVFERAPGGLRDWRYILTNPAYRALFDRDPAGATIREAFPSSDEGWFDLMDEIAASGEARRFTRQMRSEPRTLEMFLAPFGAGGGGEPRLIATLRDITEVLHTRRALERSEERLRLATEAAEIGFWDVDEVNQTMTWPSRVKAMFGFAPEACVSMADFFAGLHPQDRDRISAAYAAAADPAVRALYDVQYRAIGREDGVVRWIAAKGRGVFDADGRCLRVIGVAVDITGRKGEAERLEASEAALDELAATLDASLDYAPIGFAFIDRDLRFVRVNGTLARINARSAAEHVGRSIAEIAPTTAAAVSEGLRRLFATGERLAAVEIEDDAPSAPGDIRCWLTSFFPVFGRGGQVQFVGATVVDITDRKRAEARVRELNESLERRVAETLAEKRRLAEVIDRTDLLVLVADPDYNWLAINAAASAEFARVFGVPPPKAGDNMLTALRHLPDQQAAVRAAWARAFAGEDYVTTQEFGANPRDRRHYEMRFRALRDEDGRVTGAYQFVSDVTERLREQARLAEAEAALRQAQKMEALGQLTGGVAHDFNNLLQGVSGSFDLIRRKPDDPARVLRWAEAGLQAAERGARLTGQLLAFSRSQKLEARPLDAAALVAGMRDLLERTLGPSIRIALALDAACPPILADATQLELALLNLAINSRDAMPAGGALTVSVRAARLDRDSELGAGDFVEIAVADDGPGMPAEVAARAFEPFFTTKAVGKGTGLGLAQVYAIARQAGGVARIETRPQRGTTVRLLLPATRRPVAALPEASGPDAAPARAAVVLIVDDDPEVRRFLVEALDQFGFASLVAEDGRSGLAALERAEPDLMLLDYAMPGLNGAEVLRLARERRPNLPIVLISGYADAAAIAEAGGADATILRKPFRIEHLRAILGAALASRGQ